MVIETYDKKYTVVQHLSAGPKKEIYSCRCSGEDDLFTVICFKDKDLTNSIIEYICEQKKNTSFTDLVEHFVAGEYFHVVFEEPKGVELERKLRQHPTLVERLVIGKKIMEKLILQKPDSYFLCQCMTPMNIYVTDSGDISFYYSLFEVDRHADYTGQKAVAYLYRVLSMLFADELKKNVVEPMDEFLKTLKEMEDVDYMELYKGYSDTMVAVLGIPEEELETPKNFLFRLWSKTKGVRTRLKKVLLFVIFVGVFIYMIYTIHNAGRVKNFADHFKSIGSVTIQEGEDEQ